MRLLSKIRAMSFDRTDLGLRFAGVGLATASIAFAAHMTAESDRAPQINGVEHLAIFAQPTTLAARHARTQGIDYTPIGATPSAASQTRAAPQTTLTGYEVLDVVSGAALIRAPDGRATRVAPGERLAGAGRVLDITRAQGKWLVSTEMGLIRER